MITPRQTRLYRVADLHAFQRAIRVLTNHSDLSELRNCAVIVPTAAAADQLRRTLENHVVEQESSADRALCLPLIVTRSGLYDVMHSRMADPPRRLNDIEREVMLNAAAGDIANAGITPPFRLRAGLLVEMLGLYDDLRRRNVSIDTFERLLAGDLERDAAIDRGADRLLKQTRFLAAAFRGYERRLAASGGVDEHALRAQLLGAACSRPLQQVVVTVADRSLDAAGLWPADFDVLTEVPLLERIDVVSTRATIAAGFLDRLTKLMPGFSEGELPEDMGGQSDEPALVTGADGRPFTVCRDREDELGAIAHAVKAAGAGGRALDRRAVVFKRPLPYVYLVGEVFADAGVPYQTFDALPLAAEPYAAALDLIFEFVGSEFTREPIVALLSSPHFRFEVQGAKVERSDVAALNSALSKARYLGGFDELQKFASSATGRGAKAAGAAAGAAEELRDLVETKPPSQQLDALLAFLAVHDRVPASGDPLRERHLRARSAVLSAIRALRRAHQQLDDSPRAFADIAAMIRRWIEGQTFAPRSGSTGVQVIDAQAARYGEFDEIFLVGLVEGEWPERPAKSIFYPHSLLRQIDWPDSHVMLAGERAAFHDLLGLAERQLHLSSFQLEDEAIIGQSVFLEDVDRADLRRVQPPARNVGRIDVHQALTSDVPVADAVQGEAAVWLQLRSTRSDSSENRFHGTAASHQPPAYTVSSVERYLECPFRFFAERVLKLEEEPEDETSMSPKDLGIFIHDVFHAFFTEWEQRGHRAITPGNLTAARVVFAETVEPHLARLPDDEAAVQRTRLLGSAAAEGLAEAVFQLEAEWDTPVERRLLEHALDGEFTIEAEHETRRVRLHGKADRIDLLADGTFRIIDYKLTRAPERRLALQLPVYTICTAQQLRAKTGKTWEPGQAGYIAFGRDHRFVPMVGRGADGATTLRNAQTRLLETIDRIERGEFPPSPDDTHLCLRCAYSAVCRKDYVGAV